MQSILLPSTLLAAALALTACGSAAGEEPIDFAWPPTRGESYPDLVLQDDSGARVELSSFRGKVLLIEPIGMT